MSHPYVYIFVRKDLPNPQKVVQASHAAWELSKVHQLENHPSMVVIGLNSAIQITNQFFKFKELGIEVVAFYEPLINNEMTSFAILAKTPAEREVFKKFNLLSENSFR